MTGRLCFLPLFVPPRNDVFCNATLIIHLHYYPPLFPDAAVVCVTRPCVKRAEGEREWWWRLNMLCGCGRVRVCLSGDCVQCDARWRPGAGVGSAGTDCLLMLLRVCIGGGGDVGVGVWCRERKRAAGMECEERIKGREGKMWVGGNGEWRRCRQREKRSRKGVGGEGYGGKSVTSVYVYELCSGSFVKSLRILLPGFQYKSTDYAPTFSL